MLFGWGLSRRSVRLKAKYWYHILTGIYLIQNGKYELTEEQAQNVNLCHDKKMTLEIYNSIQE